MRRFAPPPASGAAHPTRTHLQSAGERADALGGALCYVFGEGRSAAASDGRLSGKRSRDNPDDITASRTRPGIVNGAMPRPCDVEQKESLEKETKLSILEAGVTDVST
ncbi:hypothetical protein EYF80_017414 [Liparis tanakae]|uniref:Uncharacterized protein n=1 Tax=Liparis tanakae TaxID=230148 RepID=A0A4Z2I4K2_9TELE|nr:hypothetical protein EYF80_017414 [Liparis tanakae]